MGNEQCLLELKGVSKTFNGVQVLADVDLRVRDGEVITILGPSGSGKSTILRIIGGFTPPTRGRVLLGGDDITDIPINQRPFNTVFQDYALFPHMSVTENIGYGLRVRGVSRADMAKIVAHSLQMVQLNGYGQRYPAQLSGGQRQRVALARAIICQPRLILLDEPLAALDVELRKQMQGFLKEIQREIKTTFLMVTHDQEEAIAMADRICVVSDGRILQVGRPRDLYYRPGTEFVARFFGENNLLKGLLGAPGNQYRQVVSGWGPMRCTVECQPEIAAAASGLAAYGAVRPEEISLHPVGARLDAELNRMEGHIEAVSFSGALTSVRVVHAGGAGMLQVRLPSRADGVPIQVGQSVVASWRAEACRVVLA